MNTELVVASVSGAVALLSVLLSSRFSWKQALLAAQLERQKAEQLKLAEHQDLMSQRRDPLLWAAYDLQSRLFNIVDRQFLNIYYSPGHDPDRDYALRSTLHVMADYLGQVELLRRKVQFLDLGNRENSRTVVRHLTAISNVLNTDGYDNPHFRVFRSNQRALGELVICDSNDRCLGYAEFCRRLDTDADFAGWFEPLSDGIRELASSTRPHPRLVRLQVALMDLIDFLDPDADRFPDHRRSRLSLP
ncbi:hypothetical protein OIC43_42685 [Streptomyces sp. NBC_00825]|uniref:hypothetical protein n=1 Tax=unclassified Streptomyces TaxID=2593676 RepID=UPI0022551490|nr:MULTISPECIES: hypothetical protein [unclassified Streptomyces]WTB51872.1 hypothetical protein OG832_00995 [Streptomyces sp. NBC_00826]WTH95236.1 hypothetical protein OIC43_42685 [Streptomyces sp. NBC_00825]WTI03970.1 hypothetical protein OHA23_42660 [Streptomyces sp. NBC_00822]MCX4869561.1 hypothetical protein [Streptomyces sp. NBC_00906]MCX4900800.1 hypothetical protein [Streptomyces sp. NBC_00892]